MGMRENKGHIAVSNPWVDVLVEKFLQFLCLEPPMHIFQFIVNFLLGLKTGETFWREFSAAKISELQI